MSAISEVNNVLSINACISIQRSTVEAKGRTPVHVKWIFKSKKDLDRLIYFFNSRNVFKGYFEVPGVDYTESFSPIETDMSTRIII